MRWLLDLLYLLVVVLTAPGWITRMIRTGKLRTDWRGRLGRIAGKPNSSGRRVMLHAVSVGEVNATRELVRILEETVPPVKIVVATTTDTGFARARTLYADRHRVVRYPLDFSTCVSRFLRGVNPDVVALVELEVWPNFSGRCRKLEIPVGVINGRLTARSHRRYRKVRRLVSRAFGRLSFVAAQSDTHADRFRDLGAVSERVVVTGTMKWDTARIEDEVKGASHLAEAMGIDGTKPLVVAGSTAPGEHELLCAAVPDSAQLLCAPRKEEWFDQAAAALPGCVRRSSGDCGSETGRFLLDTIGELRQAYALADLVIIGRSFGELYGSDMMEPVALGKATVVGPAVDDFRDTMDILLDAEGIVQTTREDLPDVICELLADKTRREALARRGREVIESQQGASRRHADLLLSMLETGRGRD